MRIVIVIQMLTLLGNASCGSNHEDLTPCDEARDIQKSMCEGSERCFPCVCILEDKDASWTMDELGLPDFSESHCMDALPCTGQVLDEANECINDELSCDPRYYKGISLFRDGVPENAFPNACDFLLAIHLIHT